MLAILGLGLFLAWYGWWRRARSSDRGPALLMVLAVLWWAEVGLTMVTVVQREPGPPQGGFGLEPDGVPAPPGAGSSSGGEPLTVLFMGDSFTAGVGVLPHHAFPAQVGARLLTLDLPVRVLNEGWPSLSFWDERLLYAVHGAQWSADVVVWSFVLNDLGVSVKGDDDFVVDRTEGALGIELVDLPVRALRARSLERATVEAYRHHLSDTRGWWEAFQRSLAEVVEEVQGRGGRFLFVIHPLLHRLDAYPFVDEHRRLEQVALAAGAEVVDLGPVFAGHRASELWVSRRDHHPNERGHARIADAVTEALLRRRLPRARPARCTLGPGVPGFEADLAGPVARACEGPEGLSELATALQGWPTISDPEAATLSLDHLAWIFEEGARARLADPQSRK